jgi:hypothetical protein
MTRFHRVDYWPDQKAVPNRVGSSAGQDAWLQLDSSDRYVTQLMAYGTISLVDRAQEPVFLSRGKVDLLLAIFFLRSVGRAL